MQVDVDEEPKNLFARQKLRVCRISSSRTEARSLE